jgi:hypothetical protein
MMGAPMRPPRLEELLLQGLESEQGGVLVYETALTCVENDDLRVEWARHLRETRRHVKIMQELCIAFRVDVNRLTPGREVVRHQGESLVRAMIMAREAGPPTACQLVATECVIQAETKDRLNWELLGHVRDRLTGEEREALREALQEVDAQEDRHLYHSTGWARELWRQSLGLRAVLPPPEEPPDVKTTIGAARARKARPELA